MDAEHSGSCFEVGGGKGGLADRAIRAVAAALVRYRLAVLALTALLLALTIPLATRVDFDARIETLFSRNDRLLQDYLASLATFGGDELVVVAYEDPELLTLEGLRRQLRLVRAVQQAAEYMTRHGIAAQSPLRSVTCLATSPNPLNPINPAPLIEQLRQQLAGKSPATTAETWRTLRAALLESELHRDVVIGADGRTAALLIVLKPDVGKGKQRRKLVVETLDRHLRRTADELGLQLHIAGGPVLVAEAVRYLELDGYTFLYGTTTLLLIVLTILFRSPRWIVMPLIVVHIGLVWTKAVVYLSGITLTMISSLLTAMITVIGVATVMHATVRFRELRADLPAAEALLRTLCDVGVPTFWTAATTAVGFASLIICDIAPVRTFGTLMATGSMLIWLSAALVIPGIALFPGLGRDPQKAPGEDRVVRELGRILQLVRLRPWAVVAGGAALFLFLAVGWMHLRVETDFTKNFRQSAPVAVASRFIEERLGGTGVLEVNFAAPEGLTGELANRVRAMAEELRTVDGVTKVLSLVDVLDFADRTAARKGLLGALGRLMPLSMKLSLLRSRQPELVHSFWNEELARMRVVLRARERASAAEKQRVIETVYAIARRHLQQPPRPAARAGEGAGGQDGSLLANAEGGLPVSVDPLRDTQQYYRLRGNPIVTGHYVLLYHLVGRLLEDQKRTFAIASIGCLLMLTTAFRSIRLGMLAMLPNITPIAMVVGAMGWFGLPLNVATAMLAAVSIGMAVDSSIHYVYRFRLLRLGGLSFEEAIERTHHSVGLALLFANTAIVVGFSALVLSNFIPTIHFGILISIALLGGLAGNLFLLPMLLRLRVLNPLH